MVVLRTDSSIAAADPPDATDAGAGEAGVPVSDLSTAPDEHWAAVPVRDERPFLFAIVAALVLHVLPVAIATGGWGTTALRLRPGIGDPAGIEEGVNVEIIDATEYQRRFVAFNAGKDAADSEAKPSPPPQPPSPAQAKSEPVPNEPPDPAPSLQPRKLSEADIAMIMESATFDMDSAIAATATASMAAQGQTSEFVRGVLRRLKQNMPRSNGIKGTVVIGIVLSETGQISWVGVLKSSRHKELDELVIARVRATQFDPPQKPIKPIERRFQITYEYE